MNFNISRIILYVQDVDLLKDFYQQHFHFHAIENIPGEWVLLHGGGVQLALHQVGEAYRKPGAQSGLGSNAKIVVNVTEPLTTVRKRMLQAGVPVQNIKSYPGFPYELCDGQDPEGNVFQLMQPV
jgi:catechol 2,3-dioxygenase-like lactoylglutathione lyase family enzyme